MVGERIARGAANDYSLARFGVPTRIMERTGQVLTGSTVELIPANSDRLEWILCNTGTGIISIVGTPGVNPANGFTIPPGATVISTVDEDGSMVTLPWYALAAGSGSYYLAEIEAV